MLNRIKSWGAVGFSLVAIAGAGCAMDGAPVDHIEMDPGMDFGADMGSVDMGGDAFAAPGLIGTRPPSRNDSDGDGLADSEETITDRGSADTDGDLIPDGFEILFDEACAADAGCRPPREFLGAILGDRAELPFKTFLGTQPPEADVFFLVDDTESMGPAIDRLADATTGPELAAAILAASPRSNVGLGWQGGREVPFAPVSPVTATWEDVWPALFDHDAAGAADGSAYEAIRQVLAGSEAASGSCPLHTYGAGCFRASARQVIVHITSGRSESLAAGEAAMTELGDLFATHSARYVGIDASGAECDADDATTCEDLRKVAIASGTIDVDGRPVVGELKVGGTAEDVAESIGAMVARAISRVPSHVTLRARGIGDDPALAEALIGDHGPACAAGEVCWIAPEGISQEDAVRSATAAHFAWVVPGTELQFVIQLRSSGVEPSATSRRVQIELQTMSDGRALESRVLHVLIPAAP